MKAKLRKEFVDSPFWGLCTIDLEVLEITGEMVRVGPIPRSAILSLIEYARQYTNDAWVIWLKEVSSRSWLVPLSSLYLDADADWLNVLGKGEWES